METDTVQPGASDKKLRPLLFDDAPEQLQIAIAKLAVAVLNQQAALDAITDHLDFPDSKLRLNLAKSQDLLNEVFEEIFEEV
jgi:hypothetical protein